VCFPYYSARVEKQIAELQQKGDDTKMEVSVKILENSRSGLTSVKIYQLQQQQQSAQPGQPAA